ncbi:tautomerase pptA [Escherichia coli 3-073-06_S1_C2]|nr:tautomerase pptA [Escherichia coli 3-073-06_S1_C2]
MPHIDIKCFPRELDEQQKAALAADITDVIIRHLNSKDSSISIALQQSTRILASYLGCRNRAPNGGFDKETWL